MRNKILGAAISVVWGLMSSGAALALPAQQPLFLVSQASPMVMFALSVDHQLFAKAFADYSDLNGDGVIDSSYVDAFNYYGYFESKRCYAYSSNSGYFEPQGAAGGANNHHCSGEWSGNFLNWATMTRIDVLRKAMYGGKRAVDTATQTVLERALLANDVHSFAKVFTPATGDSTANYTPYGVTTLTLCNSTPEPSGSPDETQLLDTAINPPKMRVAAGDWGRWAAGSRNQCEWYEDQNATNDNKVAGTVPGYADNLFAAGTRDAPNVKVDVCVAGKLEANCRSYNGTDSKPIGLLQEYGEDGTLRFGLVSGSYQKRDHGGVLRKAMGLFAGNATASDDEVNLTDGTFNASLNGIVSTLNKVRLNTWDYGATVYNDCDTFSISVNTYLTSTAADRQCSNWGNPVSELYLEAVRYMMGEGSPTGTFNVASDDLGLPTATWDDPMPADEWCTPMSVVTISSGDNNFDTDDLTGNVPSVLGSWTAATDAVGAEEVAQGTIGSSVFIGEVGSTPLTNPDTNICSAKSFTSLSQMRGLCPTSPNKQGGYAIAGLAYKAHTTDLRSDRQNDPSTGKGQTINTYAIAMAKTLPDFVVPLGAGQMTLVPIAYAGPFDSTPAAGDPEWASSSLADLQIEEQVYSGGKLTYVRFLAQWEDSAWGNDYDMDMVQRVSVCVGAECTKHDDDGDGVNDDNPGTDTARVTVRFMQAAGGVSMNLGFIVVGTSADGDYAGVIRAHNGNENNFSSFDDDPLRDAKEPTPLTQTFVAGTSTVKPLPLPLELAAKYGSFKQWKPGENDLPDESSEWDTGGDGVADSFFYADDPSNIGPRLAAYLTTIATTSSSASVVANTVSLRTSTRIYQARFDSDDWSGSVLSFPVDPVTGALQPAEWDVADILPTQDHDTGRELITWDPDANSGTGGGIPFRWGSLGNPQQALFDTNPNSGTSDGLGEKRVDYLRGDDSHEVANGGTFRDRDTTLGDIVNSTPTVVGAPAFSYPNSMESVPYSGFVAANDDVECRDSGGNLRPVSALDREPILYFGGNDGALHGVSACTGQERIAYVPLSVYAGLPKLTSPSYQHQYYVDGPSTVVDAFWSGAWHTVLVGTLGGGGKGVFALDVTDPGKFDETYASQLALWDITATPADAGSDFEELGYTYSQPSVVKVDGLGWVAIFGNGYHGKSGKAILYIVRIDDGTLLQTIDLSVTGPGSGSHGTGNGLSTVAPVDTDGDGDADLVYGGDRNGNVWRFATTGLSGFSRANTTLLYSAKSSTLVATGVYQSQPITSRMAVGYHPTSVVGRIVYFGTGKYYESSDQDPANAVTYNTMYGIWDRDNGATVASVTTRNSNILQQQTITNTQVTTFDSNTETIRLVSNTPVQWAGFSNGIPEACAVGKSCGWYLDLTDAGEKVVADPILRGGKLIYVTTTPSSVACEAGGSGWLMEVDPNTGGRLDVPVLDLNGDGVFDFNDMPSFTSDGVTTYTPVTGVKSKIGVIQAPAILAGVGGPQGDCKNCEGKYFSGSKQGQIDVKTENALGLSEGRKSWVRFDN